MEHLLRRSHIFFNLLVVVWGSLLLAASGAASITLPFSPVPITLQVTVVVLIGVMLGPIRGLAAVLLWLTEATLGSGGHGSLPSFLGPTGGFLLSYPLLPIISGLIAYRRPTGLRLGLAFLAGSLSVYPMGLFHLAHFVGWNQVLSLGFFPFLPGAFLKSLVLAAAWKKVASRFVSA